MKFKYWCVLVIYLKLNIYTPKCMHHVHTLLLKTARASRFSSCLSSLNSRSSLRTSSSRTCSSNVQIKFLLWRIKSLQFYLCEILYSRLPLCWEHQDTPWILWSFLTPCWIESGRVFWFQEPQDRQHLAFLSDWKFWDGVDIFKFKL